MKQKKIHTSIMLPEDIIRKIKRSRSRRKLWRHVSAAMNAQFKKAKLTRQRSRKYNKSSVKLKKMSVYWDVEFYNRVWMLSHILRISVSFLIVKLLAELNKGKIQRKKFLPPFRYKSEYKINSGNTCRFSEIAFNTS